MKDDKEFKDKDLIPEDEHKGKKGFKKKRPKEEREHPQERRKGEDKFAQQFLPKDDQVAAVNLMESKGLTNPGGGDITIPALAVLHSSIQTNLMFTRAMANHKYKVRQIVKKRASLYFSQLAPTTIEDIISKVNDVVTNSLTAFALICQLWKVQNSIMFEDEDGYNLSMILHTARQASHYFGAETFGDDGWYHKGTWGHWTISNAVWKQQVLSNLRKIYLSERATEFFYTVVGHYIKFDSADESLIKLWDLRPVNSVELITATTMTFDAFLTQLNNFVANVDAAFNSYPFMEEILNDLKLFIPGEKYDFTRDLASMRLNVLEDRQHSLENMCYMISVGDIVGENDMPNNPVCRIIAADIPGATLTYYKDDKTPAADNLIYFNRVITEINSYTNALRSTSVCECITALYKNVTSNTKRNDMITPYAIRVSNLPGTPSASGQLALQNACTLNDTLSILDLPNDAIIAVSNITTDSTIQPTGYYPITTFKVQFKANGGDYVIDGNDINSVISDASNYLILGDYSPAPIAQTLGNAGK